MTTSRSDRAAGEGAPADATHARPRAVLDAAARQAWSEFGSAATDNQRINLDLRSADGTRHFYSAHDVLGGGMSTEPGDAAPANFLEGMASSARAFLETADSIRDIHHTRLSLDRARPLDDPRANGVVLSWRDGSTPVVEEIPLPEFCTGQWQGQMRSRDPRYGAAVATLAQQAATMAQLLDAHAGAFRSARLSIRTFDAERSESIVPAAHWLPPAGGDAP